MRIHEIITEAISMTTIEKPLFKSIFEELPFAVRQIYYQEKKFPPEVRDEVNTDHTLNPVAGKMLKFLEFQVSTRLAASIESVLERTTELQPDAKIRVQFSEIPHDGQVSGMTMTLSFKYVSTISKILFNELYDTTLNTLDDPNQMYEHFFFTARAMKPELITVAHNVESLIDTVIHESVHLAQHYKQRHHSKIEYRSYLEKDPKKFNAAMASIEAGTHSSEEYKIYRASPQEIAAFAHQAAARFMRDMDIETLSDVKFARTDITRNLLDYGDTIFKHASTPAERKVYNRFMKLMSQEVIRRIEEYENRVKNTKR